MNRINNCEDIKLDISNEEKVINIYSDDYKSMNINITQDNNSLLVINLCGYTKRDVHINISSLIKGNNNKCIIVSRIISLKGFTKLDVSVKANEKTINNTIVEDLKGILEGGQIELMPILEIDTHEVNAEHYATVGSFDKDVLFYLTSKGISDKIAKKLLEKSFILSKFDKDFQEEIEGKLNE